jgi:hypothetical protein
MKTVNPLRHSPQVKSQGMSPVGLALFTWSVLLGVSCAGRSACAQPVSSTSANVVLQGYPARSFDPKNPEKSDTAWEITWDITNPTNSLLSGSAPSSVLRIVQARFMWKDRTGKPQWLNVIRNLELSEIYVPYDDGDTAFLDVMRHRFFLTPANRDFFGPPCLAPPEILTSTLAGMSDKVHKEVHDDGIRWMSAEQNGLQITDRARRGEKMVLWSSFYGSNYRYLIEYGFSDDGTLTCRLGFTARNYYIRRPDLSDTHLHIGAWRFEPDLDHPDRNEIMTIRRIFDASSQRFRVEQRPFGENVQGKAAEGGHLWEAHQYTALRFQSSVRKNSHGTAIAFDLIPQRSGAARQLQPQGESSGHLLDAFNMDIWVTQTEGGNNFFIELPFYARQRRELAGKPVTIWHSAPALHIPRSEDFGADGQNNDTGVALSAWAEFILKPRDVFDSTPLYSVAN